MPQVRSFFGSSAAFAEVCRSLLKGLEICESSVEPSEQPHKEELKQQVGIGVLFVSVVCVVAAVCFCCCYDLFVFPSHIFTPNICHAVKWILGLCVEQQMAVC